MLEVTEEEMKKVYSSGREYVSEMCLLVAVFGNAHLNPKTLIALGFFC